MLFKGFTYARIMCYTTIHLEVNAMDIIKYYSIERDDITDLDIRNGMYMGELLGDEYYKITKLPPVNFNELSLKVKFTFNRYCNDKIVSKTNETKFFYLPSGGNLTYSFNTRAIIKNSKEIESTIFLPDKFDRASYAFFGHQIHHVLKDDNVNEIKLEKRVTDTIPLFYELLCVDSEYSKNININTSEGMITSRDIANEILKRRIFLLQIEKGSGYDEDTLQLLNSFYLALGLYKKYKEDEILVLRLISRVLLGELTTLDLLVMLDLYEKDLDYIVSRELETIKQNIRS